jgi:hypothetical protein
VSIIRDGDDVKRNVRLAVDPNPLHLTALHHCSSAETLQKSPCLSLQRLCTKQSKLHNSCVCLSLLQPSSAAFALYRVLNLSNASTSWPIVNTSPVRQGIATTCDPYYLLKQVNYRWSYNLEGHALPWHGPREREIYSPRATEVLERTDMVVKLLSTHLSRTVSLMV